MEGPVKLCIPILTVSFLLVGCAGTSSSGWGPGNFQRLHWLVGTWKSERATATVFERWEMTDDYRMEGQGFRVSQGDTLFTERLRIQVQDDVLYYVADVPQNLDEVWFRLTRITKNEAVFENPQHDFPKVIVYRRESEYKLYVRVEGKENGRPKRLEFFFDRERNVIDD